MHKHTPFWRARDPRALAGRIDIIVAHSLKYTDEMPNARVLRKPQRNYGVLGRPVSERVDALMTHYKFAARRVPKDIYRQLLGSNSVELARLQGRGTAFSVCLASSLGFEQKQEGEWTVLVREDNGPVLARMAVSIAPGANSQPDLLVGGLQGLSAGADKSIIVKATRALSGLRPKDAALVGVQAVARALGIERILAVAKQTHVLAAEWAFSDSVISRDYDAFWIERGGVELPSFGFVLPIPDYAARVAVNVAPRIVDQHRAALTQQVLATLSAKS